MAQQDFDADALTRLGAVAIGGSVYVFHSGNTLKYTLADELLKRLTKRAIRRAASAP